MLGQRFLSHGIFTPGHKVLALARRDGRRPVESLSTLGDGLGDGLIDSLDDRQVRSALSGKERAIEPLSFEPIAQLLEPRYRDRLRQVASGALFDRFKALAAFSQGTFTVGELSRRWGVSSQRVSQLLPELERLGYVQPVAREGRTILHALSGAGRLALGIVS